MSNSLLFDLGLVVFGVENLQDELKEMMMIMVVWEKLYHGYAKVKNLEKKTIIFNKKYRKGNICVCLTRRMTYMIHIVGDSDVQRVDVHPLDSHKFADARRLETSQDFDRWEEK